MKVKILKTIEGEERFLGRIGEVQTHNDTWWFELPPRWGVSGNVLFATFSSREQSSHPAICEQADQGRIWDFVPEDISDE